MRRPAALQAPRTATATTCWRAARGAAAAGGQKLLRWKETLLLKLKKVASQPTLGVPAASATSLQQVGQAGVAPAAVAPAGSSSAVLADRPSMRQRPLSGGGTKAD